MNHRREPGQGWRLQAMSGRCRHPAALLHARLLAVRSTWWQSHEGVQHLGTRRLVDAAAWLGDWQRYRGIFIESQGNQERTVPRDFRYGATPHLSQHCATVAPVPVAFLTPV